MAERAVSVPVSGTALLLIDVINDLAFDGSERLVAQAEPMADRLAKLKRRASAAGVVTIYINDNFGQWRSNLSDTVEAAVRRGGDVQTFVEQLLPDADDYVILKPKHSAFHQTPLDLLLRQLGTRRLILTGLAPNSCIISTAADAHMRDFSLAIPGDGCAAESYRAHRHSLRLMADAFAADISASASVRFRA